MYDLCTDMVLKSMRINSLVAPKCDCSSQVGKVIPRNLNATYSAFCMFADFGSQRPGLLGVGRPSEEVLQLLA